MPNITIANTTTLLTSTGFRLNLLNSTGFNLRVVTVSGPRGPRGEDGTGAAGLYVTGSDLIFRPNLIGTGSISLILDGNTIYFSGADTSFSGASGILNQEIDYLSGFLYNLIIDSGTASIDHSNGIGLNLSGNLSQTGAILMNLISAASAGVSSINGQSGVISIAGAGNTSVTNNGQTIIVSGDTGVYANFATLTNLALTGQQAWTAANNNAINLSGNLTQTGITLINELASISNRLTSSGIDLMSMILASSTGVQSINSFTGHVVITGAGGITVTNQVGLITISGLDYSADQFFITQLPVGFNEYYISFPRAFPVIPVVLASVQVSGDTMYGVTIEDNSTGGFRAFFTNVIAESGVALHVGLHLNR
jgi:hypothetical protein